VDQPRNPWSDGPEFITQCPIQPGDNFTYKIILSWEEGTLWWHAHSDFDRNTVHGAIVIRPRRGTTYPFKKPHKEIPIFLGTVLLYNVASMRMPDRGTTLAVSICLRARSVQAKPRQESFHLLKAYTN